MKTKTKTKTKTKPQRRGRYVIVATSSRPWTVVAGYVESEDGDTVILRAARMIVYYGAATRALYGLAKHGPKGGARITPAVSRVRVHRVESVLAATAEARAAIEAAPWT